MVHFKKIPLKENEGKITYDNDIIDGIVLLAVNEIPYVELYYQPSYKKMNSPAINVRFEKEGVHVEVIVKVHYTQCITDIAFKIQEAVRHNVEAMTEYKISSVDVVVRGVTFTDKIEETTLTNEIQQEG